MNLIIQSLAIFAAAFLAFALEDLRERRRTRRWVTRYLRTFASMMANEAAQEASIASHARSQVAALDAWLSATDEADLTEDQWEQANGGWNGMGFDLSAVLRSEAVSVMPERTSRALAELEQHGRLVVASTNSATARREAIQDAWAERRVPISAADARRVLLFREVIEDLGRTVPEVYAKLNEVLRLLDEDM